MAKVSEFKLLNSCAIAQDRTGLCEQKETPKSISI